MKNKKGKYFDKLLNIIFIFPIPLTMIFAVLFFIVPAYEFRPITIFLGIILAVSTPFLKRLYRTRQKNEKIVNENKINVIYKHHEEIKSCNDILIKIKEFIDKNPQKKEMKKIINKLQKELNNAGIISDRLDVIVETLNDPDWDISKIDEKIVNEEKKELKDLDRLNKLNEMKNYVIKLNEKKKKLEGHLSDLALSFQTIFTKMTLIDSYDSISFDEIETEIKRILDHQLKVNEYEEKLDKELN